MHYAFAYLAVLGSAYASEKKVINHLSLKEGFL